jgi:hypothetical protein
VCRDAPDPPGSPDPPRSSVTRTLAATSAPLPAPGPPARPRLARAGRSSSWIAAAMVSRQAGSVPAELVWPLLGCLKSRRPRPGPVRGARVVSWPEWRRAGSRPVLAGCLQLCWSRSRPGPGRPARARLARTWTWPLICGAGWCSGDVGSRPAGAGRPGLRAAAVMAGSRSPMMAGSWRFRGSWPGSGRGRVRPGRSGRRSACRWPCLWCWCPGCTAGWCRC